MSVTECLVIRRMAAVLLAVACTLAWPSVRAAEPDDASPPKAPSDWLHSGSLEIPGVTACHQCEWRPKPHQMSAADRCGLDADGKARIAEFECGYSEDCQRMCNFIRCVTP
jgi:hypothetical protein